MIANRLDLIESVTLRNEDSLNDYLVKVTFNDVSYDLTVIVDRSTVIVYAYLAKDDVQRLTQLGIYMQLRKPVVQVVCDFYEGKEILFPVKINH